MLKNLNPKRALVALLALTQSSHTITTPHTIMRAFFATPPVFQMKAVVPMCLTATYAFLLLTELDTRAYGEKDGSVSAVISSNKLLLTMAALSILSPLLTCITKSIYVGLLPVAVLYTAYYAINIYKQYTDNNPLSNKVLRTSAELIALIVPEAIALAINTSIMISGVISLAVILCIYLICTQFLNMRSSDIQYEFIAFCLSIITMHFAIWMWPISAAKLYCALIIALILKLSPSLMTKAMACFTTPPAKGS